MINNSGYNKVRVRVRGGRRRARPDSEKNTILSISVCHINTLLKQSFFQVRMYRAAHGGWFLVIKKQRG